MNTIQEQPAAPATEWKDYHTAVINAFSPEEQSLWREYCQRSSAEALAEWDLEEAKQKLAKAVKERAAAQLIFFSTFGGTAYRASIEREVSEKIAANVAAQKAAEAKT